MAINDTSYLCVIFRVKINFRSLFGRSGFAGFLALLATSLLASNTVHAQQQCSSADLSEASEYNALIFGDFSAPYSDTEGRMAIQGNLSLNNYSVADKLSAANAGNSVIVGGDFTFPSGRIFYGDIIIGGSANLGAAVLNGLAPDQSVTDNASLPIDFNILKTEMQALSLTLSQLPANATQVFQWGGFQLYGDGSSDLQVFSLNGTDVLSAHTFNVQSIPANATVVFNISGSNPGLTNMSLQSLASIRERVVFNFYEATSLTLAGIGVEGTILAPNADINNPQGVVKGSVIANFWTGPMQLNHNPFEGCFHGVLGGSGNTAPVADDLSISTSEDTSVNIDLVASDSDGDTIAFQIVMAPTSGTLSGTLPNLSYLPGPDINGVDVFTYLANDGQVDSNVATVTINVNAVNDAPLAEGAGVTTTEETPVSFTLAASDIDGDTLSFTVVDVPGSGTLSGTAPNLTYTPSSDFAGNDSLTFRVNDGVLDSNLATVTIEVGAVNDAPIASDVSVSLPEDSSVGIQLLGSDVDGDTITFTVVTQPSFGTLSGTGSLLTYTPAADYNGNDVFTYVANDGQQDSAVATVSITIDPVNDIPVATDISLDAIEDTTLDILLTASDIDGDTLTFQINVPPTNGTLSGSGPDFQYEPDADFNGTDSISYVVNDGTDDSSPAIILIDVSPANDVPLADGQSLVTPEDTSIQIILTGSDIDADTLTFLVQNQPVNGSLSGAAPNLTYTPNADFNGNDGFTFIANDGSADSIAATVDINITPANDNPIAEDQQVSTSEDTPLDIILVATDIDGDVLSYVVAQQPTNGTLNGTAPNLQYAPSANFNGSDSFSFVANDGTADSVVAVVDITVNAVNDAPLANPQSGTTVEDTPLPITLTGVDIDGDVLTFAVSVGPNNGALSGAAPNLVYTPSADFNGSDSFTFVASDLELSSAPTVVSITITPGNDIPVAIGQSLTTVEDTPLSIALTGNDIDGDALTFVVPLQPANGTLSGTLPNLTYTPDADFFGIDAFEFQANDGLLLSLPASVTIDVSSAAGDAPTAASQQLQTDEITAVDLVLVGNDPDGDPITYQIVDAPSDGTLFGTAPNLTYLPNAYFEGSDSFTFLVSDGTFQSSPATVDIDVISRGNNPPEITSDAIDKLVLTLGSAPQGLLDMRGWVEHEDFPFTGAVWDYSADGTLVTHSSNVGPATVVGPFDFSNARIDGTLRVDTNGDDDLIGFVFGYQDPERYYLFRWKQGFQNNLSRGMQLWSVDVPPGAPVDYLTLFDGTPGLLYSNDIPWVDFVEYEYSVSFQPGLISITVTDDGAVVDSFTVSDSTYTSGRFGIYNFSQGLAQYQVNPPVILRTGIYTYPVAANDPDGDAIVYRLLEAPDGMIIDAGTGVITWDTNDAGVGSYPVLIEIEDPFGATDQQAYELVVADEAPVFVGQPADKAFVGETYGDRLTAFDPEPTDLLTYSLLDAPTGLSVNPSTGELLWLPTALDLGTHPITAEVVDGQGNTDTLDYVMSVVTRPPNEAPEFVSQPPLNATVGRPYLYSVLATDADGDPISYSLAGPVPYAMQMFDGINITWTPTADQVTGWPIVLEARDSNGGVTEQTFTIEVDALDNNNAPTISSQPSTVADIDDLYQYQVVASDVDGDVLSYVLVDAPPAMTIDPSTGLLQWTPEIGDIELVDVALRVSDSNGGFADQSFTLAVRDPAGNQPPSITSTPMTLAASGMEYVYQVVASDADSDSLTYLLTSAPAGMAITTNGRISWTPIAGQTGGNPISIEVSDGNGGTATQSFAVFVPATGSDSSNNGPMISSIPGVSIEADVEYVYIISASDPDGDALDFKVMQGPIGMTVDAGGVVRWQTDADDVGDYTIRVEVTDGRGGSALQGYELAVYETGSPPTNSAPQITTNPASFGKVGVAYSYAAMATDADGDSLTYSLTQGPIGMTIDAAGLLTWAPDVAGDRLVRIQVSDGVSFVEQGWTIQVRDAADAIEATVIVQPSVANLGSTVLVSVAFAGTSGPVSRSLTIDGAPVALDANDMAVIAADVLGPHTAVATVSDNFGSDSASVTYNVVTPMPNTPPAIVSAPPVTAKATFEYRYAVVASDAEGDLITYSVETGPAGMTIDTTGLLTWTPGTAGVENVVIRVSDGQAFVDQGWTLTISDAGIPLEASISANPSVADLGSTVELSIGVSGAAGEVSLSMTVDGAVVPVNTNGVATVAADTVGLHTATAIVTDPFNTDTASITYTVIDPNSSSSPPVVSLTTPDFEEEVTAPRDAIGTVTDPDDDLLSWSLILQARGAEPTEFTTIANGTTEVPNDVLGQIDPTMLLNGLYSVILQATDAAGNVSQDVRVIRVTGDLKVGNFSITFEDFSAPVAGLPVTVLRTYDTRRRNEALDFGHGWSIDYQNVRLQESRDIGFSWTLIEEDLGLFSRFCVRPNGDPTVTVRMPDGEVESFVARAEPECTQIVPTVDVQIVFDPIDDTDSRLEQTSFGVVRIVGNNIVDLGDPGVPIDADSYRLTTPEGLVFSLDQSFGIQQVEEPNGNTLTFSNAGVVHSQGFALTFNRDPQGRITSIVAPDGTSMAYGYDANGDLESFTDQVMQTTTYTYQAGTEHYLEDILDPRGIRVSRNEYDAEGRLTAIIDADGNRIEYDHDIIGQVETVRDRRGNPTVYVYDDEGNVLVETNALGESITRTYDNDRNELSMTNDLGHTTSWSYDERGNQLTETNALMETTTSSYDSRNLLLSVVDPLGNLIMSNVYDTRNTNLQTLTDALGNTTTFHWDAGIGSGCSTGASRGTTDALLNRTVIQPQCLGPFAELPLFQEDARGTRTSFSYDSLGRQISETTSRTDEGGAVQSLVTTMEYDDKGRLFRVTDSEGNVTVTEYNGIDKAEATIDANLERTEFLYDDRGNLVLTTYPDLTTEIAGYDEEGNVTSQIDRLGRTTTMVYDAANRLTETIFPDDTPGVDTDNPRTTNEFDTAGRLTATIDELGNRTEFEYDDAGRRTLVRDALLQETRFEYDVRGLRTAMVDALNRRTEFVYDNAGRLTETIFPDSTPGDLTNNLRSRTGYDALGRKSSETDLAGVTTTFEYDQIGNLTAVIDALSQRTEYGYDEQSNKVSQTDAELRTTNWSYDDSGRVTSRTLPEGQSESFTYDDNGNRIGHTDFNGAAHTFAYDELNRQTTATYADGVVVTMTYTDTGQVEDITDDRGTTSFNYDERERLSDITYPSTKTIGYGYDDAGNRTSLTTANQSLSYTFDVLNRLETVTDEVGTTTYSYDAVGNREGVDHADGTRTQYVYDLLNRLTVIANRSATNAIISSNEYVLGPNGNRTQDAGFNVSRVAQYTYDDLYRVTSEKISGFLADNRTTTWTYDAVGNRLTQTRSNLTGDVITTYTYDDNDRLTGEVITGLLSGSTTYSYDDNGNTLTKIDGSGTTSFAYDSRNRLSDLNNGQTTYEYDATGIRQSETSTGLTTHYLTDPNRDYAQVIEESFDLNSFAEAKYTYGDDLLTQHRRVDALTTNSSTYHYDGLGSTRALTDASGAVTDTYAYTAFGELESSTGTTPNDYLYTGEQFDPNLGFYYLRARYYNAGIGRFQNMDTFAGRMFEPVTLHKYLYANVDPIGMVDPSGNLALPELTVANVLSHMRTISGRQILRHAFTASAKRNAKRNGLLVVAALAGAGSVIHRIIESDEKKRNRRDRKVILYHGTTSNAASKIVKTGFRSAPVFFAEDLITAGVFALEASGRNNARSTTIIRFVIPLRIAETVGIGPNQRAPIGKELGLPFVDIAGGTGYERIIRTDGQRLIFNGALSTKQVKTTRLRQ